MSTRNNIMIDIEGLDTLSTTVIFSIGACFFDPATGEIGDKFYMRVNPHCKYNRMRTSSEGTLKFWSKQPSESRAELDKALISRNSLYDILYCFGRISNLPDLTVWANGNKYDLAALEDAYRQVNLPTPWQYNADSDVRTLRRLNLVDPCKIPDGEIAHHALHDAMWQAKYVSACLQELELLKSRQYSLDEKRELSELMAVLHRDGGQYENRHGTEKAIKDAKSKAAGLIQRYG